MGYKPTENYAAKDFLESGDPDKIVMGKEIQADFDAISRAFTDTDNKLNNLDYVDLRGDTMTGPLSAPEVIADNFVGGDVSANVVKATGFEGNGSGITGITIDQLTDVSAPNPQRDQVLTYNGSAWESVKLDIVDSDLTFKGPADLTSPVPGAIAGGDMYVSESSGTIDSSWTGLGGSTTAAGDFVAYSDTDARWFNLGSVAGGAVTSVGAGSGIVVDALQPTAPVVSVDRSETDSWYADKSDTEDGLRDVNSALATTTLRVDRNETDISDLREDLTLETEARADSDAELLALIQAARPGSQVTVGDDAPDNPIEGDLWYCTLDGSHGLFVWHESAWLATDPEAGPVLWKACPDGTFFDGGSVGVNTDTPYSRFHVDGENTPEGGITLSSGANHHTNYLSSDFVNVHDIESSSPDAAHTWAIDGDEKVRIDADGKLTVDGNFTSVGIDDNATSTAITIDANENVGIGTTSPFGPLDVKAATDIHVGIADSGSDALIYASTDAGQTAVVPLKFQGNSFKFNGSSEFMRIDAAGNVGIGTSNPATSLDIVRAGVEPLRIQSTTSDTVKVRLANTAGNAFINGVGNDIVIPSGNVGIGGTPVSSARKLMVKDAGDVRVDVRSGTDANLGAIDFSDTSNTARGQLVYDHSDDSMQLKTLSATRMTIDAAGTTTVTGGFEAAQPGAGANAFAAGYYAGETAQGTYAVAIGPYAGNTSQGTDSVAVGRVAGQTDQGNSTVAIGFYAGNADQTQYGIAIGREAGRSDQGDSAVSIGRSAGTSSQAANTVAVGYNAGNANQDESAVAVGVNAGSTSQGLRAVAVGSRSGYSGQSDYAIAVGYAAGQTSQGTNSVAIGKGTGETDQGEYAVAMGYAAGQTSQAAGCVAIGNSSGKVSQGDNSIAIGNSAGVSNQGANGIIISSSGTVSDVPRANHICLKSSDSQYLFYNGTDTWTFAGGTVTGGGLRFDSIVQDGAPVVDSLQIIRAFMKLRDAVDDPDSSVEELREKLKVAVVDIIDQFQDQIDTMPVPEEPSTLPAPEAPELGTMPTPESPSTMPAPERPKRRD